MRGKKATRRLIAPDPKFHNVEVAKFVNYVMRGGKRTIAQKIIYGAFDIIEKETQKEPLGVFEEAMRNVSPIVEVKSRRVGGANYQIPIPVRGERRFNLASRWMIAAAKGRKGKPMAQKLAAELIEASQNQGSAIKKKVDVHRMAEANRAFAHFAR